MSNVTPVAASAGVSFEEVNAAIAQLTLGGTKTAEATTQIRQAIVALLNPNETMKVALAQLGFASGEAMLKQLGLVGSMQRLGQVQGLETTKTQGLKDQVGKLSEKYAENQQKLTELAKQMPKTGEQSDALAKKKAALIQKMQDLQSQIGNTKKEYATFAISGNEGIVKALGSVEALGFYLNATGANAKGMANILGEMKNAAGSADKAYNEMEKSATRNWEHLMTQLQNLRVEVGSKVLPVLSQFVDRVKPIVAKITEWMQKNPKLTQDLIILAGAVGGLGFTVGPLLMSLPGFVSLLGGAGAVLFNPVGLIAALTLLVGGSGLLVHFNDTIFEFVNDRYPNLAVALDTVGGSLEDIGKFVSGLVKGFGDISMSVAGFTIKLEDLRRTVLNLSPALRGIAWLFESPNLPQLGESSQAALKAGKLPGFAMGGLISAPLALVGERGPELISAPRGSRVYNNAETREIMAGGPQIANAEFHFHTARLTPAEATAAMKTAFRELALSKA
jgi:hypothetical protein